MARAWPLLLVLLVLGGGCAVTTAGGDRLAVGSAAFRAYVERVFRAQNRVASELAFALEADGVDAGRAAELENAERALLDACAEVNALAAARRDGRSLGAARQAAAARSAPECERATAAAERALGDQSQGGSGRSFDRRNSALNSFDW